MEVVQLLTNFSLSEAGLKLETESFPALPASCLLDSVQAAAVAVGTGLPEQPCTGSSKVMLGWGGRQLALSLCALQLPPALGMAQN